MTDTSNAPIEPNHNADASTPAPSIAPPAIISDRPPRAVLTKTQARERIKAAGRGEDPDKIAPLTPPKAIHAAEPAEPPKEKKPPRKAKVVEVKKSEPPAAPAAKVGGDEPTKKAPEAKAAPSAPSPPAPAAKPAAPPPEREKADLAKKARAVDRDVKRVEARAQQVQQAEEHVRSVLEKLNPRNEGFMDALEEHFRAEGLNYGDAIRAWAAKKRGQAAPATPGQPPPPVPQAPPQAPQDPELEQLKREHREMKARAAKDHWKGVFRQELTNTPPDATSHPTLATLDEDYLSEVMVMTASQVFKRHGIKLDTLQLYDMIEEAEAEEQRAQQKKLKRQPQPGASPEREPAGKTQKHEPSKANQPIDVSSRARAGSPGPTPKRGKLDRDKLKEILRS